MRPGVSREFIGRVARRRASWRSRPRGSRPAALRVEPADQRQRLVPAGRRSCRSGSGSPTRGSSPREDPAAVCGVTWRPAMPARKTSTGSIGGARRRAGRRCPGVEARSRRPRCGCPKMSPHRWAPGDRPCRSSQVSGPSNGTLRPNSSFEWRLGREADREGADLVPCARARRSTAVTGRAAHISRASSPSRTRRRRTRRAIAGASTAWSQCVWPIQDRMVRSERAHVAVDQRRVRQRRPAQDDAQQRHAGDGPGRPARWCPRRSAGSRQRRATRARARRGSPSGTRSSSRSAVRSSLTWVDTLRTRQTASRAV